MDCTSASPGKQNKTDEAFMMFFRNTEQLNQLTPDDRTEIFRTVLSGSADLTKELLNEILSDYSVDHLEVTDLNHGGKH